jgi:hypothetical protein
MVTTITDTLTFGDFTAVHGAPKKPQYIYIYMEEASPLSYII